jgi:hypothetical protein
MSVNRMNAWMGSEANESAIATATETGPFIPAPVRMNWLAWQYQMYQRAYELALVQMAPTIYDLAQKPSLN